MTYVYILNSENFRALESCKSLSTQSEPSSVCMYICMHACMERIVLSQSLNAE